MTTENAEFLRTDLAATRRWVIKVGSALLTDDGKGINETVISSWAAQIATMREQGIEVVMVSSGAVAAGIKRLGWPHRPETMHELQAAAAVGQSELVHTYERAFGAHGLHCAQILLTHADLANRQRYLNARNTLNTLLELGVIPIINENDTVATEEIRFGDNDNLAALVANIVDADVLVVLTDQNGLFTADPREDSTAELVESGRAGDKALLELAGKGSELGRGGMQTKLLAAETAALSGTHTLIVNGREADVLTRLRDAEPIGTLLLAGAGKLASRKQWLAMQMRVAGTFTLDEGAVRVLSEAGRSLLPVGVTSVEGEFVRGELVSCIDGDGKEVARGLSNYNTDEARKIMGKPSDQIAGLLGYAAEAELIHRNNLVLS